LTTGPAGIGYAYWEEGEGYDIYGQTLVSYGASEMSSSLRAVLVTAGFTVVEATTEEEALAHADGDMPVAVLLDLDDGEASGYLVCKLLRERYGDLLPIIFLSGERMQTSDRVAALLLGADDYVVKPFDSSEVVARLRRLIARSAARGATTQSTRVDTVDDFDLTKREQQIMGLLLRGLTQAEIARELVISSNTVATHIQRILLKLGVHNRAQAVAKVARAGWLQREDHAEAQATAAEVELPAALVQQARESLS
jgi:DNA-binding NarL/FixJ family response regulator